MPITQDRLYRVVQAANAFYSSLLYLRQCIADESLKVDAGTSTANEALNALNSSAARLTVEPEHAMTLAGEQQLYRLTHARNARSAYRASLRRREQGIPQRKRTTRPHEDIWHTDDAPKAAHADEITTPPLPSSADVTETIDFGPEPTLAEQAEQIRRDNEEIAQIERGKMLPKKESTND